MKCPPKLALVCEYQWSQYVLANEIKCHQVTKNQTRIKLFTSEVAVNMTSMNRIWLAALVLHWLFMSSINAQETIEITTSDPLEINSQTNAFVSSLFAGTPSDEPIVFRVDQLTDALVEHANSNIASGQDRIRFVMNGLSVTDIFDAVIYDAEKGVDVSLFAAALLGLLPGDYGIEPHTNFLETHEAALLAQTTRNFTEEILQAYSDVVDFLGWNETRRVPAPMYQLSYGYERATNAKTVGLVSTNDGLSRCFVWFNLGASRMLQPQVFRSAAVHETWHCVQYKEAPNFGDGAGTGQRDLLQVSLVEGFATFLTKLVSPDLSETELLFWTDEELEAAKERKEEIVDAFEKDRSKTAQRDIGQWYFLDIPLSSVQGAPSRSGYYVAYLALQAYVAQLAEELQVDQTELVSHLIEVIGNANGREDVFQALLKNQPLGTSGTRPSAAQSIASCTGSFVLLAGLGRCAS